MELLQSLNLGTTAEIVIIVAIVYALVAAVKQTKLSNKWLPWISMILGIVAGLVSVLITSNHNFASAGFLGFIVGGFTSGLYDGISGFLKKAEDEAKLVMSFMPEHSKNDLDQGGNLQGKEIPETMPEKVGGTSDDSQSK
ncbi:holin [Xylocopilactobacillus apis]|uniref:Holin n=1 Tax=Xylocopilactobacillus apis TaxID=2932183 RepID=A0AAU9DT05_9LACO|nr:holin [Xylocopilactobacillus apis]BDR56868.1 hypothetical protein KIMC2_14300 [Xylocopilactobacillus apis]